jgi:hypothetical protein
MSEDYGKTMGNAIRAVAKMHSDTSRLLQDCDGTIGKDKASVFGSYATRDLTYNVRADQWMAQGVYRYYDASAEGRGLVDGIMAYFFGRGPYHHEEPLLIVGRIQYHLDGDAAIKGVCQEWDLWYALFDWGTGFELNRVLTPESPDKNRVEWIKLIAAPLYSIQSMEDVVALMKRVQESKPDERADVPTKKEGGHDE